jgi:hypothetical protein
MKSPAIILGALLVLGLPSVALSTGPQMKGRRLGHKGLQGSRHRKNETHMQRTRSEMYPSRTGTVGLPIEGRTVQADRRFYWS